MNLDLLLSVALRTPHVIRRLLVGPAPRNDRGDALDPDLQWLLWLRTRFVAIDHASPSVEEARQGMRESVPLVQGPARDLDVTDDTLADVPVRRYRPRTEDRLPVLLYLHGGGWAVGDLDTHDRLCQRLAADGGCLVVSLHYRRSPEHPYPAGLHDVIAAWQALPHAAAPWGGDSTRMAVGGDSAGGNLSAALCLHARDHGLTMPAVQLLIYPGVDATQSLTSQRTLGQGYMLEHADVARYVRWYGAADLRDPMVSPLFADDHHGLAPAIVTIAGFDPLRDEGEAYAACLRAAGVPVVQLDERDQIHGYANMDGVIPGADAAMARITDALRAELTG